MGSTGLVYSSHQHYSVDETEVDSVKTCSKLAQVLPPGWWIQLIPDSTIFSGLQTAKLSVSRSDRLQLPRPWAPVLKYGASTGVYCSGQRYGNKGPPLRWGQSPWPQRAQGIQEHHIWLSHFIAKKTEPKKKKEKKNKLLFSVR